MALFIPAKCDCKNRPRSEQAVFEAIRENLSNDWVVFYSFSFIQMNAMGERCDGEVDFLLYHVTRGFLVLEVKGGTISYLNGQWYQDNRPIEPVEQAKRNKYAIRDLLERKLGHPVPLKFAHAVCFPGCSDSCQTWPAEAEGIVFTYPDLRRLESAICCLLDNVPKPRILTGALEQQEVIDLLSPEFLYEPKIQHRLDDQNDTIDLITENQLHLLEALEHFPRLAFEGGAGTGKTNLAIMKAKKIAGEGGRVLFLCYNELLAKYVRSKLGFTCYITVEAFFEFCVRLLGIPAEEVARHQQEPTLYTKVFPNLLERYLSQNPKTYDALIVDEAQDFTPQVWEVIQKFVPDGIFYVFYDPDQNIFHDTLSLPDFGLPPIALTRNCRNTRQIFNAMKPYGTLKMELSAFAPWGEKVKVLRGDSRQLLTEELNRFAKIDRINLNEIVVLGAHSLKNTSLAGDPVCGDYTLLENARAVQSMQIKYYTYMKFKGCEARVVILLDVDDADPRWDRRGRYTAMSRAINQLIILSPPVTE